MDGIVEATVEAKPSIMDLQKILEVYGFKVEKIGGVCTKCGRFYSVHFYDETKIEDVSKRRFECRDCSHAEQRAKLVKELV